MTEDIGHCLRCAVPCRRQPGNPEARLLKRTTGEGFCPNCAATEFLQGLDVVRFFGGYDHVTSTGKKPFDPACFLLPHVQDQFAAILRAGKADAKPGDIDWLEVVANWHLPFPKLKRKGRRP